MFKVLAQSLRLGQPPDATTAVRVLVEVVEKQQAELEELRSKLSIASSRIQYAEARLARLLEAEEGHREASHGEASRGEALRSEAPRGDASRGSQRPPPLPAGPTIPKAPRAPSFHAPPLQAPQPPHAQPLQAQPLQAQPRLAHASIIDSGLDEFNQTLVIHRRDIAEVADAEAPFPLAPVSDRPRAPSMRAEGTPFQTAEPGAYAAEVPSIMEAGEGDATVTQQTAVEALSGPGHLELEALLRSRREPGRE